MKKLFALLLATVMLLACLAACGKEGTDETGSTQKDNAVTTTGETNENGDPASSGDIPVELPATDGDLETEPSLPATDGDLTENG